MQYPIIYYLRKLLVVEQNYNFYNKKLIVNILILKTYRENIECYLNLTIFKDYKNLIVFLITKEKDR